MKQLSPPFCRFRYAFPVVVGRVGNSHKHKTEQHEANASRHSDENVVSHNCVGYDMQDTMPSEPATAVSTAINTLSNLLQLTLFFIFV